MVQCNYGHLLATNFQHGTGTSHYTNSLTPILQLMHLKIGHAIPTSEYIAPHGSEGDGRITDRGIFSIVPRDGDTYESKLEFLDATNTLITDQSLVCLSRPSMAALKYLTVKGTGITAEGCGKFMASKPKCVLDHDGS